MDSLHCEKWLLLGASSFPLDRCEDGQAVSVCVERAGGRDGKS